MLREFYATNDIQEYPEQLLQDIQSLDGQIAFWEKLSENPLGQDIYIDQQVGRAEQMIFVIIGILLSDNKITEDDRQILSSVYLTLDL